MTREEAVARIKDHIEIHKYHERNAVKIFEALDMAIKALEQPEEDKLKKIADALSEKMSYMNMCPNERDIILGYLEVKRPNTNHCNTDCWNEECKSYHYETRKQPEHIADGGKMDCISRQAAIDAFWKLNVEMRPTAIDEVVKMLRELPSTQPERKKGTWCDVGSLSCRCSECGCKSPKEYSYCPNCGADMKGEQE